MNTNIQSPHHNLNNSKNYNTIPPSINTNTTSYYIPQVNNKNVSTQHIIH